MKPSRGIWTGIAVLTFALTIAEGAALMAMASGARQWWASEDGRAVRRAGAIVSGMLADQIRVGPDHAAPRVFLEAPGIASLPLAARGVECSGCAMVVVRRGLRPDRERILEIRQPVRERVREALRRAGRQMI